MTQEKIELKIDNPRWKKLDGYRFFLTKDLFDKLSTDVNTKGETSLSLLKHGRYATGFKHLIEVFSSKSGQKNLIFTDQDSFKNQNDFYVNFDAFKKIASSRYWGIRRSILLDTARYILSKDFPSDFSYKQLPVVALTDNNFEQSLSSSVKTLVKRPKHRTALYKGTYEALAQLKKEIKLKKKELDEIQKLGNASNIAYFTRKLEEFKARLKQDLPETRGSKSWQRWIYNNNWLFGVKYHPPIQKEQIGFDQIPDFLFPTTDGFLDILEIKKPIFDVIIEDKSHPGAFQWSGDTNQAIGQVVNYLHETESHYREIQERIKRNFSIDIHAIKPRAFILIGDSTRWDETRMESLRKLNYSLHGIEIITYSDLMQRGQDIIDMYTKSIGDSQ